MKRFHPILTSLFTAALVIFMGFATPAHAVAPAGSRLSITATVSYDGIEPLEKKSYGVTIWLSRAAPVLATPEDQTVLPGESITYNYSITTRANGPDTYDIDATASAAENVYSGFHVFVKQDPNQNPGLDDDEVMLGATAASTEAQTGEATITVPSDGEEDGSVNGIKADDLVVVNGVEYEVDSVADTATSHISLKTQLASPVEVGDLIAERQNFEVKITDVEIGDSVSSTISVIVRTSPSGMSIGSKNFLWFDDETMTTILIPVAPSIEIYVRNITTPETGNTPEYISFSGKEFFGGFVSQAIPGDILEYAIVQTAGNTKTLTDIKIKTTIPLFSSYLPGTTAMNNVPVSDTGDPAKSQLIDGMEVNSPGQEDTPGTVTINSKVEVTFKVKMDEATTEETESTAESQPASGTKVAWTEGNDACWDPTFNDGDGGWAVGVIDNSDLVAFCTNQVSEHAATSQGKPPAQLILLCECAN